MLNDAAVSQFKKVYLAHGYTYTDHSRDRQADQYYANLGSQQQLPPLIYQTAALPPRC